MLQAGMHHLEAQFDFESMKNYLESAGLKMMAPFTAGTMHTRVNANWDLATAMRYLENDLKWHGLYTIETGQGHAGTKEIFDVVVNTLTA